MPSVAQEAFLPARSALVAQRAFPKGFKAFAPSSDRATSRRAARREGQDAQGCPRRPSASRPAATGGPVAVRPKVGRICPPSAVRFPWGRPRGAVRTHAPYLPGPVPHTRSSASSPVKHLGKPPLSTPPPSREEGRAFSGSSAGAGPSGRRERRCRVNERRAGNHRPAHRDCRDPSPGWRRSRRGDPLGAGPQRCHRSPPR